MIRVLVAEDSATARALLVGMLREEGDIVVVGEATTGTEAVDMAEKLRPDLVTMDIRMPELDGIEAIKRIMTRSPRPILVVSSAAGTDVELSLEAMRSGALMVIAKPSGATSELDGVERQQFVNMVRALAQVKVVRRHGSLAVVSPAAEAPVLPTPVTAVPRRASGRHAEVVAIAASTGGPAALRTVLAGLPGAFPLPVLVVQHIAKGFTEGLVHWLGGDTRLRVKLAEINERAAPATVYIAPDDRHLGVFHDAHGVLRIRLDRSAPIGTFRPSATYLFRSCAEAVGQGVLAVILTGMGDDGVEGLHAVRQLGGRVIAQDEATSVIYGMPREAQRAGVVDQIVSLDRIARRMVELSP